MLIAEESDKLLDQESVVREAIAAVEQNGIVFLDEIDKICGRSERGGGIGGADVSREGVQRDLLPLIEGTTVATKHGPVQAPTTSCSSPRARSTWPSRRTCCPNCRAGCRSASS